MSLEPLGLPTDSLYKMLTLGGLVFVIGGIAMGWKAIDQTQSSVVDIANAESAIANATLPVQRHYHGIVEYHRRIERKIEQAIAGVNVAASREFKGGQPIEFPSLTASLSNATQSGIEWGVTPAPTVPNDTSVADWLAIAGRMRSHHEAVDSFLNAPNLTAIGTELRDQVVVELRKVPAMVDELENRAIEVSSMHQLAGSARLRHQLAVSQQRAVVFAAVPLFFVGAWVFARASLNWYMEVQRYEDARLKDETKGLPLGGTTSIPAELKWLAMPIALAILVWLLGLWIM